MERTPQLMKEFVAIDALALDGAITPSNWQQEVGWTNCLGGVF